MGGWGDTRTREKEGRRGETSEEQETIRRVARERERERERERGREERVKREVWGSVTQ